MKANYRILFYNTMNTFGEQKLHFLSSLAILEAQVNENAFNYIIFPPIEFKYCIEIAI